ncbi:glycoside hydrolase family 85 protein [Suillus clintonianus]|uniref:glycoside hydrolase family 85 protein n=1 Tax=Suillus clintonianus TaxID=1904413 RepID=UPI001B860B5D|nr:glycoside hydrolase family 85 protein [Suillus clintonianus]KAG2126232.1 glycoside hydrolase family 85 protein [Suillus clintonianus]
MPLRGTSHGKLVGDEAPYFESLAELDQWASIPHEKLMAVLEYQARPQFAESSNQRGKLLVCHDYKGGYTESPSGLCYTFNFWPLCDSFVYFSHHRVTVPPSGWINAAHRQGVKMLGTIIFEGSGEADCLQLIVGCPQVGAGPTLRTDSIPMSRHYASVLAELARQRGFDGYLLNVECPLRGGQEQARALAGWILLLRSELVTKVGRHAQAIWYDSVIINGQLRWQDRLNNLNLPFFLSSDAFFTNYTWPTSFPALTAQYFMSLDPVLISDDAKGSSVKSLQSIFTGVDVWGRGSHGGGGFGSYKAITHIDPQSLGLSVALFGQAWTWESEQDKPGWNWDQWWEYERKLWIGPADPQEVVPVPDAPRRPGEPECPHGAFKPLSSFFGHATPPDPAQLVFYASFSPGVGHSWFVEGVKVLQTDAGWTDVDKQSSLGNLVWPRPSLMWEDNDREEPLPSASSMLDMSDAWNGGNTLKLSISCAGSAADDAFFRCIWLPVQSFNVTSLMSYDVSIVYKTATCEETDLDLGLYVKPLMTGGGDLSEVNVGASTQSDLKNGWTRQVLSFSVPPGTTNVSIAVGLIIGFTAEDPSQPLDFSISLGQLAVYPSSSTALVSKGTPGILWAKFQSTKPLTPPSTGLSGLLTWDIASSFPRLALRTISSPEDPNPAWILDTRERFPSFLYFNIYVNPYPLSGSVAEATAAIFIGTTGLDGRANRFYVDPAILPKSVVHGKGLRFYVQGVTDKGDILPWEMCAHVDYMFNLGGR